MPPETPGPRDTRAAEAPDPGPTPAARPSSRRTLIAGTLWQALPQMAPLVFNLALTPYVIHGVSEGIYGIYLLVMALQFMLASLDGGIGPSANRHFGIHAGRGDAAATTRLLTTLQVVVLTVFVPITLLVFWFTPQIVRFFPATDPDPEGATLLLRVMMVIVAVAQVRGLFTQVLHTRNRFAVQSVADLAGYVAYAIGMVVTVETGAGLAGIAWAFIAQQALTTLIVIPGALPLLDARGIGFIPRRELVDFFRYAWKIQVSGIVTSFSAQGDAFFVGRFAPADMTPFGVGQNFATTLRNIPQNAMSPIRTMMGNGIGSLGEVAAAEQAARLQRIWVQAVTGWIVVGAPAALFGVTAWLHLGTPLPGWVAATVLVAHGALLLVMVQRLWANVAGESAATMRVDVENLVVKIALTLALITLWGAMGAVLATLVANVFAAVRLVALLRRLPHPVEGPWRHVPWGLAVLCAALSGACSWAIATFVVGTWVPFGPLALFTVGLGAAPAMALYYLRTFGWHQVRRFVVTRGKG
nr:oligosaccharide flippase family protein [Propioniciclava soli]